MMDLPYVDVACMPRKHTAITNCIVKVIQTTFYQQQLHKYFNLIIYMKFE